MIEPEIAFEDLEDDINLAEDYLKYCVQYALEMCAEDLEFFEKNPFGEEGLRDRLRNVLDNPFKVRDPCVAVHWMLMACLHILSMFTTQDRHDDLINGNLSELK